MTQNQQIIERDFYYEKKVTSSDILKFIAVSAGAHLAAYYYILCFTSLISLWKGTATYVVLQVLLTIPVAIVLPSFLVHRYLASAVPKLFSLRDDVNTWHKKAIRLIIGEEALRFLIGLLPLPFTAYGVLTSPVTYLIYTLVYVNPMDKYEEVLVNHHANLLDTAVFLLIYLIYFSLYNFFLFRKFKKEVIRQHTYLEGCLAEKQKSENYYR